MRSALNAPIAGSAKFAIANARMTLVATMSRLSVKACCASRPRPAPSARRIANSFSRAVERLLRDQELLRALQLVVRLVPRVLEPEEEPGDRQVLDRVVVPRDLALV